MFRHGARRLDLIPYESGATKTIDLPRDRLIKKINLQFDATLVLSGGTTSGTVNEDATAKLISKIEVLADGVTTLRRFDGQGLYHRNWLENGCAAIQSVPASGDSGNHTLSLNLDINFDNNIGLKPSDTFLLASAYRTLVLAVTWADPSVMFSTANDRTKSISNAFGIRPIIYETTQPSPILMRFVDYIDKNVSASAAEFPIDIPIGNRIYQAFIFKSTEALVLSSAIINYFNLISGDKNIHYANLPDQQVLNMNKKQFSLENAKVGFYYLPMMENGRFVSGFSTVDINSAKWNLDVTAGAASVIRTYIDYVQKMP